MYWIKFDIVTMKNLYTLLETIGLEGLLLGEIKGENLQSVFNKMLKTPDILNETLYILTGRDDLKIKDFVKVIARFIRRNKAILTSVGIISDAMKSIKGKSSKNDLSSNNIFLDMIYQLGKIGNYDCGNLTLDEAMYYIYKSNKEVERQNEQMKKNDR